MIMYYVWKRCRLAGYVNAHSDSDALTKAKNRFGEELFVERTGWNFSNENLTQLTRLLSLPNLDVSDTFRKGGREGDTGFW